MKVFLFYFIVIFGINSLSAQVVRGYYIDNFGKRTEGYLSTVFFETINNDEAVLNFSIDEKADLIKIKTTDIIEVGIEKDIKFKKFTVELDNSNLNNNFDYNKYPEFKTAVLFLNVVAEGDASLYSYTGTKGVKYFYAIKNKSETVKQLFFKKYYFESIATVRENTNYRLQLFEELSCQGDSFERFSKMEYEKASLVEVIESYNKCHSSETVVYKNKNKNKANFVFTIFAGIHNTSVKIGSSGGPNPEIDKAFTYRLGGEIELKGSEGKFGIFARGEYENYKVDSEIHSIVDNTNERIDFHEFKSAAIDLLVGGRYHFNRQSINKIFFDGGLGFVIPFGDINHTGTVVTPTGQYLITPYTAKTKPSIYLSFGLGFDIFKNFGAELRTDFGKKILNSSSSVTVSSIGVNLRYSF